MSTRTTPPAAPAALMTAEEFANHYANAHADLVKGVVKEYALAWPNQGAICHTVGRLIADHVEASRLGHARPNGSFLRTATNPDSVRGADVSFVSHERLPRAIVINGMLTAVPDLVVELRTPSERPLDMLEKVIDYLTVGVRVAVILDPPTRTAYTYRDDVGPRIFRESEELVLPDVLPGFSVVVSSLFD
jgi:Uma2 family endonuclease